MIPDEDKLLARAIKASLWVGVVLLAVKIGAAASTGSSAIYSDAAESVVNVLAALFAAYSLQLSRKPADENHHYGHEKAAYVSAGFEGAMIAAAACFILYDAIHNLIVGAQIKRPDLGLILTAATAGVNAVLGIVLLRVGRRQGSVVVEANGQHVLTDVWTSAGVIVGLVLVMWSGNPVWDPVAAIIVALNILFTGWRIVRKSLDGLMDAADPVLERAIRDLLEKETRARQLDFHQLRYRHSGRTHWVEVHLTFPDDWRIDQAHASATEVEAALHRMLTPHARIITHLEPLSAVGQSEAWEA